MNLPAPTLPEICRLKAASAPVLLMALALSACQSTKPDAQPAAPASLETRSGAGAPTTRATSRNAPASSQPADTTQTAPPAMQAQQPENTGIGGLSTRQTAIRAGRSSIFAAPTAAGYEDEQAAPDVEPRSENTGAGPVPADLPRRGYDATTGSVFAPRR